MKRTKIKKTSNNNNEDVIFNRNLAKLLDKAPEEWREECKLDCEINEDDLIEAVITQHQVYINYSSLSATASKYRDLITTELEEEKAKLDLKIRRRPKKYKLPVDEKTKRPMETAIKSKILIDDTIKELNRTLLEARRYAKTFNNLVIGVTQRKEMISLLGRILLDDRHQEIEIKKGADYDARDSIKKARRKRGG